MTTKDMLPNFVDCIRTFSVQCEARYPEDAQVRCLAFSASYLLTAVERSGYDISPCMLCGLAIVCVPDGLPMCEDCAVRESEGEQRCSGVQPERLPSDRMSGWPKSCLRGWRDSLRRWVAKGGDKTLSAEALQALLHAVQCNLLYIEELEATGVQQ